MDISAARPNTYNHTTGAGGSWSNRVESLAPWRYACTEVIVIFARVAAEDSTATEAASMKFKLSFDTVTVDKNGPGYAAATVSLPGGDGNSGSVSLGGVTHSSGGGAFTKEVALTGFEQGEAVVVKFVAELACSGGAKNASNAVFHAALVSGEVTAPPASAGTINTRRGRQTVPAKQNGGSPPNPGSANVSMTKATSNATPGFNQRFSYTIRLTNSGSVPALPGTVTDAVNSAFDVISVTTTSGTCTETSNSVSCSNVTVPARAGGHNGVTTITINVAGPTLADCNRIIPNTSVYNGTPGTPVNVTTPACPGGGVAPITTASSNPGIQVIKTASAPDPDIDGVITYTFVVTNTGNTTLTGVTLDDDKLPPISLSTTTLAPSQSVTATARHTITAANLDMGSITNIATAVGTPPSGPNVRDTDTVTVALPARPGIDVEKTASHAQAAVGDTVTYRYVVTNTGNVTLTAVTVVDDRIVGPIVAQTANMTLAPGESAELFADYLVTRADGAAGVVTNHVVATGRPPRNLDPVQDEDEVTLPVGETVVLDTGFIQVSKLVEGVHADEPYTYTVACDGFTLGNAGAFSIRATGGEHEVGVAVPTGTRCTVTETGDGGADLTTVAVGDGPARTAHRATFRVAERTNVVTFTNAFGETVARPDDPALPVTGADVARLALGAVVLAAAGLGFVNAAARRREEPWLRA